MSATNSFENAMLLLYFNNVDHAGIGDAAGLQNSAAAGSFYLSFHTADPGEAGTQATSEATYTGYARVAVARTAGGWTVTGNQASNTGLVAFGTCTAGSENLKYIGIGDDAGGAGNLHFKIQLDEGMAISSGLTPEFAVGTIVVSLD